MFSTEFITHNFLNRLYRDILMIITKTIILYYPNNNISYFLFLGFESADTSSYDIIIVDPWTWAAKGMVLCV